MPGGSAQAPCDAMRGLQAYGTARGACCLLSSMSLKPDVLRSRKTAVGVEELAEEFEPLLNLKAII